MMYKVFAGLLAMAAVAQATNHTDPATTAVDETGNTQAPTTTGTDSTGTDSTGTDSTGTDSTGTTAVTGTGAPAAAADTTVVVQVVVTCQTTEQTIAEFTVTADLVVNSMEAAIEAEMITQGINPNQYTITITREVRGVSRRRLGAGRQLSAGQNYTVFEVDATSTLVIDSAVAPATLADASEMLSSGEALATKIKDHVNNDQNISGVTVTSVTATVQVTATNGAAKLLISSVSIVMGLFSLLGLMTVVI